jgi:NAD(P)H-quinone oxidoreductase subunit 5
LYIVQKLIFGQLLPASATISLVWADAWLSPLFIAMFIGHIVLRHYNHTAFGTWLWQRLFAGLYLDEWATRVTLKLLPTSLPVQSKAGQPFKGLPNEVTE